MSTGLVTVALVALKNLCRIEKQQISTQHLDNIESQLCAKMPELRHKKHTSNHTATRCTVQIAAYRIYTLQSGDRSEPLEELCLVKIRFYCHTYAVHRQQLTSDLSRIDHDCSRIYHRTTYIQRWYPFSRLTVQQIVGESQQAMC